MRASPRSPSGLARVGSAGMRVRSKTRGTVKRTGHGAPLGEGVPLSNAVEQRDLRALLPRFWADRPIVGQFPYPTAGGADVRFFMDQELGAESATAWLWHDPCDKLCGGRLFRGVPPLKS